MKNLIIQYFGRLPRRMWNTITGYGFPILLLASWLSINQKVPAQSLSNEWLANYGTELNEAGQLVIPDTRGNIFFTGSFSGNLEVENMALNSSDRYVKNFICKMDKDHRALWLHCLDAPFTFINSISTDRNDNLFITGTFADSMSLNNLKIKSFGVPSSFLIKADPKGEIISSKILTGSDRPPNFCVSTQGDNNTMLYGSFSRDITIDDKTLQQEGGTAFFMAHLGSDNTCDSLGLIYLKFKNGGRDFIQPDHDGNIIILISQVKTISVNNSDSTYDGSGSMLLKFDQKGLFQWSCNLPGVFTSNNCLAIDGSNDLWLAGRIMQKATLGKDTIANIFGNTDILVLKIGKEGQVKWKKIAGGTGNDICNAITLDPKGNAWLTGSIQKSASFGTKKCTARWISDIFITRINPTGDFDYLVDLGGYDDVKDIKPVAGQSIGIDCCLDPFGNLYLLGNLGYDLSLDQKGKNRLQYKGASDILVGKFTIAP